MASRPLLLLLATWISLAIVLFSAPGNPLPFGGKINRLIERYVNTNLSPENPPDGADNNWESDTEIVNALRIPAGQNNYVFWSEIHDDHTGGPQGSELARNFARTVNGFTVADCFDEDFPCETRGPSPSWWLRFVDRVAGVFADSVPRTFARNGHDGILYLVTDSYHGLTSRETTFARVEYPTLALQGYTSITFVNARDTSQTQVRVLGESATTIVGTHGDIAGKNITAPSIFSDVAGTSNGTTTRKSRRTEDIMPGYTMNWDGYGDDPNGLCPVKNLNPIYAHGECGVHLVQYRADHSLGKEKPVWSFNVTLKDGNAEPIDEVDVDIQAGVGGDGLFSMFPLVFSVIPGTEGLGDTDPLLFKYGQWVQTSDDSGCSVGDYAGGYRQMDCGFPCN